MMRSLRSVAAAPRRRDAILNHIHQNFACYGNNPPPYTDLGAGLENTVDGRSLG